MSRLGSWGIHPASLRILGTLGHRLFYLVQRVPGDGHTPSVSQPLDLRVRRKVGYPSREHKVRVGRPPSDDGQGRHHPEERPVHGHAPLLIRYLLPVGQSGHQRLVKVESLFVYRLGPVLHVGDSRPPLVVPVLHRVGADIGVPHVDAVDKRDLEVLPSVVVNHLLAERRAVLILLVVEHSVALIVERLRPRGNVLPVLVIAVLGFHLVVVVELPPYGEPLPLQVVLVGVGYQDLVRWDVVYLQSAKDFVYHLLAGYAPVGLPHLYTLVDLIIVDVQVGHWIHQHGQDPVQKGQLVV